MDFVKYSHRLRRAISSTFPVIFSICLTAGPAWAQTGDAATEDIAAARELEDLIAGIADFTAPFEQVLIDDTGFLVESLSSTGTFSLLRPDRFRWHYVTPDELVIVSDGDWYWTYDVAFEQASRNPLSDLANSPAMLLSSGGKVTDQFHVSRANPSDGNRDFELVPVDPADSDFISAKIAFRDGAPVSFELLDGIGETTRIEFAAGKINSGLEPAAFDFVPPDGVQVDGVQDGVQVDGADD